MERYADMIMEKAELTGVKVTGLETVPTIIQGRPLFDYAGADVELLKSLGQDPEDMFEATGKFNLAVFPGGRVEALKIVSNKYKVVQHQKAIWGLMEKIPEGFGLESLQIGTSPDGGKCFAKFKSNQFLEVAPGDKIQYRLTLSNSADTSKKFWISFGAWQLICSNGMMAPDSRVEQITKKRLHRNGLHLGAEIESMLGSLDASIESMGIWKQYAQKSLKAPDIDTVFTQLEAGPRVQEELLTIPLRGRNTNIQSILDKNALTAWDLYSSFTQRITDSDSVESTKMDIGAKVSNVFDNLVLAA